MKDKIDFRIVGALLSKQAIERIYPYKRGNFDGVGALLRLIIAAALITVFVVFFGKFLDMYLVIKTDRMLDRTARASEILTIVYTALIIFMTIGAIGQIGREIFDSDDVKLFSAMPVPTRSLFAAKLIIIYLYQVFYATVTVLTVNLTVAAHTEMSALFFVVTVATCLLLPLVTIAIASVLTLPFQALKQLVKERFVVMFIAVTLITGVLFYAYMVLISAVKELLLGDSLQYFFDERTMTAIIKVCAFLYPAKWLVCLMLGRDLLASGLALLAALLVCFAASVYIIRWILRGALQSRTAGSTRFVKHKGKIGARRDGFWALVKKEFLVIFRTPSYMFSYFSVALVMPIMVYSCMSIGSSLVVGLVGLDLNLELALFLTLLFGALTNIFCATNVSRDGIMFYSVKAMPVSYKKVFFSKIFLCMTVTAVSQLASAVLLLATGYVQWYVALLLFGVGTVFGFVHICVATRYDFEHAQFSTEDDGEIKESSGVVSAVIVLGIAVAFLVGGAVFVTRILTVLRDIDYAFLSYVVAGVAAIVGGAIAYYYFVRRLGKKYYEFDGGGI